MNSWSAYKPRARHHLLVWVHAAHKIAHNHDLVYNIIDFTKHNIGDTIIVTLILIALTSFDQ